MMDIKYEKTKHECLENLNSLGAAVDVCEFISDVIDLELQINQTSSKYLLDLSNTLKQPHDITSLLTLIQKMVKSYRGWSERVVELGERVLDLPDSPSIDPVKLNTVHSFKASSTIHRHGLSVKEGEVVTVTDTTVPNHLKVKDRRGNEGYLPLLTCLIPTPHPGLHNSVYKLRVQLVANWREMIMKLRSSLPIVLPPFLHQISVQLCRINENLNGGTVGGVDGYYCNGGKSGSGGGNGDVGGVFKDLNNNEYGCLNNYNDNIEVINNLNDDKHNKTTNRKYTEIKNNNKNIKNNINTEFNEEFCRSLLLFQRELSSFFDGIRSGQGVMRLAVLKKSLRRVENALVNVKCEDDFEDLKKKVADADKIILIYTAFRDSLKRFNEQLRTGNNKNNNNNSNNNNKNKIIKIIHNKIPDIYIKDLDHSALIHCQHKNIRYLELKLTATESTTLEERTYTKPPSRPQNPRLPQPQQPQKHTSRTTQIDSITDPRSGEVLTLSEALRLGVLNYKSGHLINIDNGDRVTIVEAIKSGLIKVSRRVVGKDNFDDNSSEVSNGRGDDGKENGICNGLISGEVSNSSNVEESKNTSNMKEGMVNKRDDKENEGIDEVVSSGHSIKQPAQTFISSNTSFQNSKTSNNHPQQQLKQQPKLFSQPQKQLQQQQSHQPQPQTIQTNPSSHPNTPPTNHTIRTTPGSLFGLITLKKETTRKEYIIENAFDVRCNEQVSLKEARTRGVIIGGVYKNNKSGEFMVLDEAVKKGWVVVRENKREDGGVEGGRNGGSRGGVKHSGNELEGGDDDGDVTYSVKQVYDCKKEEYVTFLVAIKRKLIDADSGCFVNNVTRELKYPAEAIKAGDFIVQRVDKAEASTLTKPLTPNNNQFNLFQKYAHSYFGNKLFLDFQGDNSHNDSSHENNNFKEKCISIHNVDV